jgi:hypothetical protein
MNRPWSFAELAIEAMYQLIHLRGLKDGLVITREEFWRTPGMLIVSPLGYLQLMRAGVVDMAFQQQFGAPAKREFVDLRRRN